MAVRKVVTRSSCHFRGYFPSIKNGHPVAWESQLEGGFLRLLELSPSVLRYEVQPSRERFLLGDTLVDYVPDLRVFLADGGEWWFEVKPEKKLLVSSVKRKLCAAKNHFSATDRSFSVVTEGLIWREPLATNIQKILYHRYSPSLPSSDQAEVWLKLNKYKPQVFHEVISLFGEVEAWRLLGLCIVGVDLEKPLLNQSQVFLSGGHRHANFFA
ncbi:transposase [Pseudomonas sp. MYb187]|uniref:TnsA endonuclease N-terminal domain-containing protein n=1 Tax=Pseudomonas TaxID=286 RepID=UPI000CFADD19|nr:TnsA endonuclease N-terminal domain-containing protein [Pseudomonas sp. MYb187]PRA73062.1 transposase [Pseudomonas sp. MYb187]